MNPRVQRALISVSDKQGLVEFARGLTLCGVELYSTGGTRAALEKAGIPVVDVASYTGFPEMMDGRLKTLHPLVHGGILCRHNHPRDMGELAQHGIRTFELVVVNLYPFAATIARAETTFEEAVEQIDIGGPTMVRSAAKNHAFTSIVTDASQYDGVLASIRATGCTTEHQRFQLAAAAFEHTARYDRTIADWFAQQERGRTGGTAKSGEDDPAAAATMFPERLHIDLSRRELLRYGENPHQKAALYATLPAAGSSLVDARKLHGKELSYNNLLDLNSAWAICRSLPDCAAVVIKHNNPCGAASAATVGEAAARAMQGDPLSAFGSVLGFNRPLDAAAADALTQPGMFIEAIIAPGFSQDALTILTTRPKWRDNVRLLEVDPRSGDGGLEYRAIDGGFLVQQGDHAEDPRELWKVVTQRQPSDHERRELEFAWAVVRHVKSNAIVVTRDRSLSGAGAGQMSRVDSVNIALGKAGERARGGVLASDAFFPFDDSIAPAAAAGITAIIQPGGSKRDEEVIAACNAHNLTMIFTSRRHFRH